MNQSHCTIPKPTSEQLSSPAEDKADACSYISLAASSTEDPDVCWICLSEQPDLFRPCCCPRYCHVHCLARWQLQNAGTRRETHCEFCDQTLPDWRASMTPHSGSRAPAIMNVSFSGVAYSFEVQPGPKGYTNFADAVRAAFNLPEDSDLNITFTCDEPCHPGSEDSAAAPPAVADAPAAMPDTPTQIAQAAANQITLQGAGAFDAAVHCASVSAARRLKRPNSCVGTAFDPALRRATQSQPRLRPSVSTSGALARAASLASEDDDEGHVIEQTVPRGSSSPGPMTGHFRSLSTSHVNDVASTSDRELGSRGELPVQGYSEGARRQRTGSKPGHGRPPWVKGILGLFGCGK